jgi:hypothetical protein
MDDFDINDYDILEEMETRINRWQHSTVGFSHAEIFEIIKRGFNDVKYDFMVKEYNKRLESAGIKQDTTA